MIWKGKAASSGIAIGKAVVYKEEKVVIPQRKITDPRKEWGRLLEAIESSKLELHQIYENTLKTLGPHEAAIFEAHLLMLEDPEVLEQTQELLNKECWNVEYCFDQVTHQFAETFAKMDNVYFRERSQDVRDVAGRVLGHLLNVGSQQNILQKMALQKENLIVVANDLKPSFMATMDPQRTQGILVDIGGRTSHTAILARNLEIPAVVGLKSISSAVQDGTLLAFNGDTGEVWLNPTPEIIAQLEAIKARRHSDKQELEQFKGLSSITLDGHTIELVANIGTPEDLGIVQKYDAEGIGLFRTEFLFLERQDPPSEESQYLAYKKVLESMSEKTVIIRTLDIGADKRVEYLGLPDEENPALGYRAIRYCLEHLDIFKAQLRALLRASPFGNLGIMVPMIQSLDEVLEVKRIIAEVKQELLKEGISIAERIQMGVMVEIPALIWVLDEVLPELDFVSVGTNDLIQYLCAADRMNEKVADLHNAYHPAVLRALKVISEKTHAHKKWVGMCGDMAGHLDFIPFLLGIGFDELSMSATHILPARKLVRSLNKKVCEEFASRLLMARNSESVREIIKENPSYFS